MDVHPIRGVIIVFVLILVNAITEAMVTAFESVSEPLLEKRKEEDGDKKAIAVLSILERHRRMMTATDLIRVASFGTITYFFYKDLAVYLLNVCEEQGFTSPLKWTLLVLACILQIMIVELFSIKLPKKLAFKHAEGFAESTHGLMKCVMALLGPVSFVLEKITLGLLMLFHVKASELEERVTEEEILSSVTEASESGAIEAEEAEMINNIFEFDDTHVYDVMTHRRDIVAINVSMDVYDAMNLMLNESYTRYPVYEGSVENIIGILHLKDVMTLYMKNTPEKMKSVSVRKLCRKPYFVPDTQSLDVLLSDMQKKRVHMAVAIDEYGQTAGIVTMEDILEEIVGEIQDEYDDEEVEDIRELEDGSFIIRGSTDLEDVAEATKMPILAEDVDTLNGLIISELDHIPQDDEHATITYNGYSIEILETKDKMITLAKVCKLPEEEAESEESENKSDENDKDDED
ncbi:MAG: hemolysin family protein [Lachnospiraceae bacterium]|nr:hemolysin family protein [Lachnospiraceae bacterium]